jgi:hypothetical protein
VTMEEIERAKAALACPHERVAFMPPDEFGNCWCCVKCHTSFNGDELQELVDDKRETELSDPRYIEDQLDEEYGA